MRCAAFRIELQSHQGSFLIAIFCNQLLSRPLSGTMDGSKTYLGDTIPNAVWLLREVVITDSEPDLPPEMR